MDANRSSNPWPLAGGLTGLCVVTLVGGIAFVISALKPKPVPRPTSFSSFTAADKSFRCDYPSDWKVDADESGAVASAARFKREGGRIFVMSDLAGSLTGEIQKAPGDIVGSLPPGAGGGAASELTRPPVEKLHLGAKTKFEASLAEKGYQEYDEQSMQSFQSAAGDARYSEFTARGSGLKGNIHGYRATILATERRITVSCRCPESDWPNLKDAFLRVIGSVAPGGG
jgi:hypothetical protein